MITLLGMNQIPIPSKQRMRYVAHNFRLPFSYLFYQQRLYFTLQTETIPIYNIIGKCYIQHPSAIQDLDSWLCHEDHFYVQDCLDTPPFVRIEDCSDLTALSVHSHSYCVECYKKHMEGIAEQSLITQTHKPLQTLELFSGSVHFTPSQ